MISKLGRLMDRGASKATLMAKSKLKADLYGYADVYWRERHCTARD